MTPLPSSAVLLSLVLSGSPALAAAQSSEASAPDGRGLRVRTADAFTGYTLFVPESAKTIYLIDMQGEVVHRWDSELPPGSLYLLDSGNLLFCARPDDSPRFNGGGIGGELLELDWGGEVVWRMRHSDDYQCQHHDIEPLPNGNVLLVSWEHRYREDAVAYGRDPAQIDDRGMWPDAVYEVRPTRPEGGEVVWEWHAWDHLIQDLDPALEGYGSIPEEAGRIDINADHRAETPMTEAEREALAEQLAEMRALGYFGEEEDEDAPAGGVGRGNTLPDWLHVNSVDYDPENDLIVIGTPTLSEVWVIDHSTTTEEAAWDSGGRWGKGGELLYRWGNPRNYGAGEASDRVLYYQHQPEFLPGAVPGELRLLIFNNNAAGPGAEVEYSEVLELVLPFDPEHGFTREPGAAFGPREPAWSYSDVGGFHSSFISGAERLRNGNTLICSGAPGRIFEVTRAGEVVWEYLNPHQGNAPAGQGGNAPPTALFRATRIAPDHPGLAGKGLPPAGGR